MTDDIAQALKIRAVSAKGKHYEYAEVPVLLLLDAAAEIGRLRGEVERSEGACRAAESRRTATPEVNAAAEQLIASVHATIAPAEAKDPAPAMPNGVERLLSQARTVLDRLRAHDDDAATVANRIGKALSAPGIRSEPEYDRELIADMLSELVYGVKPRTSYTVEAIAQQRDLLIAAENHESRTVSRAADNRDAAGVEHEREMLNLIDERDHREAIIDKLCDAVLGPERQEWSSAYGFDNAIEDVEEAIRALEKGLEWPDDVPLPAAVPAGEAVAVCGTCNGVGMIGGHRGQTPDSYEEWAEDCPDCTPQPADGEAVEVEAVGLFHKQADGGCIEWLLEGGSCDMADGDVLCVLSQPKLTSETGGVTLYTTPPAPVPAAGEAVAYIYQERYGHNDSAWVERINRSLPAWEHRNVVPLYAHPPAAPVQAAPQEGELRKLVRRWRGRAQSCTERAPLGDGYRIVGNNINTCADELEAALQHRGDSQEVGRG